MPHIELKSELPGIISLLEYSPITASPLNALAQVLLRGESTLTEGERELIAGYVSSKNDCNFCCNSHISAANYFFNSTISFQNGILKGLEEINLSSKMHELLNIASKVQQGGKKVTEEDIEKAKSSGATDKEIHDTVLIAAAFCMYNRYVDGLATFQPTEKELYDEIGERIGKNGYFNNVN